MRKKWILGLLALIVLAGCTERNFIYLNEDQNITGDGNGQVKVSSNDANLGYLNGKLTAGSNITLTELNDGGNEQLQINATGSGTNCSGDINCFITSKFDINGPTLTLEKDPTFGPFTLGDNNRVITLPFGLDTCVFTANFFPCSGMTFFQNVFPAVGFTLASTPRFLFFTAVSNLDGTFWSQPYKTLPAMTAFPDLAKGAVWKMFEDTDANVPVSYVNALGKWAQIGLYQSATTLAFNLREGMIRQDLNVNGNTWAKGTLNLGLDNGRRAAYVYAQPDLNRLAIKIEDNNGSFVVGLKNDAGTDVNAVRILDSNVFFPTTRLSTQAGLSNLNANTANGTEYIIRASTQDLKNDIEDYDFSTSFCLELYPKKWIDKQSGKPGAGLIAEEIKQLLDIKGVPDWVVVFDVNGDPIGIDESVLDRICWAEVIRLHEENQALKTAVCKLLPTEPFC